MPWISRGDIKASRIYLGSTPVTHVYRGSELIWKLGYGSTFVVPPPSPSAGWDFTDNVIGTDATITRSGTAWGWNASKVLVPYSTNVGRIDYDPETGTILGLLVEPAATNLLLWSRRLAQGVSGGAWITSGISVSDNVVGRDGGSNKASTITATTTMATLLSPKTAAVSDYIFSAWVKRKIGYGAIDVTVDGGATWVEMTAQILGGQWVRIGTHLLGVNPFLTNPSCGFRFHELGDQLEVDLCQLEAGPEATSEIITEGSAVTRNAETLGGINIPGIGSGWIYTFVWPTPATVRGARWLKSLSFSNVMPDISADMSVAYITSEPGKPVYHQTIPITVGGAPAAPSIFISGHAPIGTVGRYVYPDAAILTASGSEPIVVTTGHQWVRPDSTTLSSSGLAPTVAGSAWIYPDAAVISASGPEPTVVTSGHRWDYPDAATSAVSGLAPTVLAGDFQSLVSPTGVPIRSPTGTPIFVALAGPDVWIYPDSATLSSSGLEPTVTTI